VHVVFKAEGITLKLPYSYISKDDQRRPLLKFYDFSWDIRTTDYYFDMCILTSPITVHLPGEIQGSLPSFVQLESVYYHWHTSYGPAPTFYTYKSKETLTVPSFSCQILPSQLNQLFRTYKAIVAQVIFIASIFLINSLITF
jgi:hypothetical protein